MSSRSLLRDKKTINLSNTNKKFKILVADNSENITILSKILSSRGHHITITDCGIECIRFCATSNDYDIIFVGNELKNLCGIDVIDMLRNTCGIKSIIFGLTDTYSNSLLDNFRNVGVSGMVVKPIQTNIINNIILALENKTKFITDSFEYSKKQLFLF
jgi:CheY-like chemotaxis protein